MMSLNLTYKKMYEENKEPKTAIIYAGRLTKKCKVNSYIYDDLFGLILDTSCGEIRIDPSHYEDEFFLDADSVEYNCKEYEYCDEEYVILYDDEE